MEEAYTNPRTGYHGADKMARKLGLPHQVVKQELSKFPEPEPFIPKKQLFTPILAEHGVFQADLMFFSQYEKYNDGISTILCIVEVRTRQAFLYPLGDKSGDSVELAFNEFLGDLVDKKTKLGYKPPFVTRIETDKGSEFLNKWVQAWLKDPQTLKLNREPVVLTTFINKNSTGIIERFNRTLRDMIERYLVTQKNPRWIDHLADFEYNYNHTYHRTIKTEPDAVDTPMEEEDIQKHIKKTNGALPQFLELHIGDKVRISMNNPRELTLGHKRTLWSRELYTIFEKDGYNFLLKDTNDKIVTSAGKVTPFKAYQLFKTRTPDKSLPVEVNTGKKEQQHARKILKSGIVDNMEQANQLVEDSTKEIHPQNPEQVEKPVEDSTKGQEIRKSNRANKGMLPQRYR